MQNTRKYAERKTRKYAEKYARKYAENLRDKTNEKQHAIKHSEKYAGKIREKICGKHVQDITQINTCDGTVSQHFSNPDRFRWKFRVFTFFFKLKGGL